MRVEGGESIQADCDCWTDSEPPSLARHWLVKRVGPSRSRLSISLACCIRGSSRVSPLSPSLLFASLSFRIGEAGTSGFPRVASRETVGSWRFPTSRRVLLCWQVFASLARWPRVVSFPHIRVSLPDSPLLPVRSTSPSITLSTQARTPNNLP
jgi:hypothetical protein